MILKLEPKKEYELIDSGEGQKLERYGDYVMVRPDKEAMWPKSLPKNHWDSAHMYFKREGQKTKWIIKKEVPKEWNLSFSGINFIIKPTSFKHIGLFPEQSLNWVWMRDILEKNKSSEKNIEILNLFAYTGGATLACASRFANVTHVDASKQAVSWARMNTQRSSKEDLPIRWIIEDVILFLKREIKRGRKYDAFIMDPPAFGHGPKDELWKIEDNFLELMDLCKKLLSDNPLFFVINGYTAGYSPLVYENNLRDLMNSFAGHVDSGELTIKQSSDGKLLPCGIFARWQRD